MAFATLAERVQHILDETGYSAAQIAKGIGCSREAVLQWANGATKNIKNELLFALADFTGFEARWIATGKGPERRLDVYRIEAIEHMAQVMQTMSPYDRDLAVKLIDRMADPKS
jgi:transcriptional regulator with XRE-family HTH domain